MDRSSVLYQAMPAVGADGKNIMKLIPVLRNNGQPFPTQAAVQRSTGHSSSTQTPVQIINAQSFPAQMPALRTNGLSYPTQTPVQIINAQFFPTQMPVQRANGQAFPSQTPVQIINRQSFPIQMPVQRTNEQSYPTLKPVQIINSPSSLTQMPAVKTSRQSFLTQASVLRTNGQSYLTTTPQKVITVFNPLLQSAPPQFISRLANGGASKKQSPQQQTVTSLAKIPQTGSPSVGSSIELPVTVKSPTLPKSNVLNVPTRTQVKRISVSKDQPVVKEPNFSPSACFSARCSSPTVIYVSPVTTMNQKVTQTIGSAAERLRELALKVNTCDSLSKGDESQAITCDSPLIKGTTPKLKLIPKVSQRPNSPTRWVIEEMDSCTAQSTTVKHLSSESASSGCLQSFSVKEDVPNKTLPENPWVIYDGRMFYVTKKGSSPSESPAATQLISSSPQQPAKSPFTQTNEVIDLCGDGSSPSSNMPPIYCGDEDNVVFVSYVPPKSKSGPAQKHKLGSVSSNIRTDVSAQRDGGQVQSTSIIHDTPVYGPAEVDRTESLNINGLKRIPDQQVDPLEMDAETGSSANPNKEECASKVQNSEQPVPDGTSLSTCEPCQKSDHQLRNIFGITADLKICLQKIDETPHWCFSANFPQTKSRGPVHSEKSTNVLKVKEVSLQDFSSPDRLDVKVLTEPSYSISFRSPDIKLNTKPQCMSKENCCSGLEMSFLPEGESVIGYVEPIDEDFPDENDISQLRDTPVQLETQTCLDVNTNMRRVGRTRKRTMCPCCVPTILHPVIKSATKLEEAERWMSTTQRSRKRRGRTKASRNDGRTSRRISFPNCKVHQPPASSGSSTASTHTERLKRHEQIRRHNEHLAKKQHK
ncbi:hypothetical protein CHARACLAT_021795 [Characodon lateralis]|uniref:Ligand-dependent nuclear receptor-interacting factor 1 n=1 Tax=Characodon lateralis TaxID=208331 RepID=A0ABU7CQ73_9TELE|nr:hypothetical protein [Characodon lateralis]